MRTFLAALSALALGMAPSESAAGDAASLTHYTFVTNVSTTTSGAAPWLSSLGTMDGLVHTNGEWHFAGHPSFTDTVSSSGALAWYFNNGAPVELGADHNGTIDVPAFAMGFQRSAPVIVLPDNAWTQQGVALFGMQLGAPPSNAMLNVALGLGSGSGAPNSTCSGPPVCDLLYVSGAILDLRGPDRVGAGAPPAIASSTQLHVVAANDIVVRRDLTCDGPESSVNVLALFSAGGAVRVGTDAPDDLRLDAFVLAPGVANGQLTVDAYDTGTPRGTLHLRGGVYENFFGPLSTFDGSGVLQTGYRREFSHDGRGVIPPYFPTLARIVLGVDPPPATAARVRLEQPHPNPAPGAFTARYALARAGVVSLQLLDVAGRRIATLADGTLAAGEHRITWTAAGSARPAPGVYFLRLEQEGERRVRRIVLRR